jgi:hypothetical protein
MIAQPLSPSTTASWLRILGAILISAALLRAWGVNFGQGVERPRPDEEFVVGKALAMLESGELNPHFFHYPTLVMYADALLLRTLASFLGDPESARLAGRWFSVLCGVGTVALIGFLGLRLFSRFVGLAAAAFLAGAHLHVRESHFATTDAPFNFLVVASVAAAAKGQRERRPSWFRLSAILAGLAASAKYPGVLALAPIALAILSREETSWNARRREAYLALFLALASFAFTSPYVFLDPAGARTNMGELFRETWGSGRLMAWDPWYPFTVSLSYGIGVPLLGLGVMGLIAAARGRSGLLLLAWFVPYLAAAMLTPTQFARYSLPLVPPLCLAAAAFLELLPLRWPYSIALFATALAPPVLSSVAFDRLLSRQDTRALASRWIADNLPPGTGVAISGGYGAPALPEAYPVRVVGSRVGAVREAERDGFDYLVTHEHEALRRFSRVDESLRRRLQTASLQVRFDPMVPGGPPSVYDALDAFYVPYAGFGAVARPGPVVSIWKLSSPPGEGRPPEPDPALGRNPPR